MRARPIVVTALAAGAVLAVTTSAGSVADSGPGSGAAPGRDRVGRTVPLAWQRHVERYAGPLSQALREQTAGTSAPTARPTAVARATGPVRTTRTARAGGPDRQVGVDSEPPVRQSNPAVVASLDHPLVAVAAFNDAAAPGYQIVRTADGGRTWTSLRQAPQLPTGEVCSTQTPALAFSRRDHAFYLAAYCGTAAGASSVQVWASADGTTWTPPRYAATAVTNVDPDTGEADPDVVYSWDRIAVDNAVGSPHYGRVYLTWSAYHLLPSGESDYCPSQVAWTDTIAPVPSDTTFTTTQLGPDGGTPGGVGRWTSAWTRIATRPDGDVLALYAQEDCNSGLDHHVRVVRSTDGGRTFGPPVAVDRPGQFADNPDPDDLLPDKDAPLGISPALAVSPATGRVAVVYQNDVDPGRGADVWVSTSDDGRHWSGRPLVDARGDQFFPWVAADPSGRFWAVWLDTRRDPGNHLVDAWAAASRDGVGWRSRRLSDTSYDPDDTSTAGSSLGVVTAIDASRRAVFPLWPDARAKRRHPDRHPRPRRVDIGAQARGMAPMRLSCR